MPVCGAHGRQGLAGQQGDASNDRALHTAHPVPLVCRAPEGPAGLAAVPSGDRAWPGNTQTPPTDWRPPRGLRGLAGLRDDAPSDARGADGSRAGRRPRAHKAARPEHQREGRCTRYGALHPNRRGVMPTDRVQRTQSQGQTRNLRDDADTHKAPGARAPGALSIQRSPASIQQSAKRRHQSPISSQQPLHNHQSTISQRSRWRRRGRPRR